VEGNIKVFGKPGYEGLANPYDFPNLKGITKTKSAALSQPFKIYKKTLTKIRSNASNNHRKKTH